MKNKTVIVTGASSGIGQACAVEFARRGAKLALAARNTQKLEAVAQQCRDLGAEVLTVAADVSRQEDCQRLVGETVLRFGGVDVLLNNAGQSMRALFADTDLKVLQQLMDVNFWGAVYCTKAAMPWLLKGKGTVVGISSIAGFKGLPGRSGYSASKFALNGFLESLRIENLKTGLHVLTCAPGFTASNIRSTALAADGTAQGESPRDEQKMMQPQEVAAALANAIEKRRCTLVLTRQGKLTVLLNKLFPRMMDRMVYNHMAKEADSPFK